MTVITIAMLALEDMVDEGKATSLDYVRQDLTDTTGKYVNFYQSREDLRLGNPFLSVATNLDGKPMIVQHLYNFEDYKSMEK
jgi:hypothetical protein